MERIAKEAPSEVVPIRVYHMRICAVVQSPDFGDDGVPCLDIHDVARIIHGGSGRNRIVALRDGHVEPREAEAYLNQYVEVARGEPARRRLVAAANPRLQQKRS